MMQSISVAIRLIALSRLVMSWFWLLMPGESLLSVSHAANRHSLLSAFFKEIHFLLSMFFLIANMPSNLVRIILLKWPNLFPIQHSALQLHSTSYVIYQEGNEA